ncbi:PREDICTED: F-box only protein 27-like [Odobenus rosmarus divergens]|uniref:F-box only protein 27-like n=1 Tax=Odobenus rosmarus divergens TaxID=9708 RepID=A0A9B0GDH5_ODORO
MVADLIMALQGASHGALASLPGSSLRPSQRDSLQGHTSPGPPAQDPQPEPELEEVLGLSRLPPELLLVVLSHMPPCTLLGCCCQICGGWHTLVDSQAPWPLMLAQDHSGLYFCEKAQMERCNLRCNPCGQEGLRKWMVQHAGDGWVVEVNNSRVARAPLQGCFVSSFSGCGKKQVLDLEEQGVWPELLDGARLRFVSQTVLSKFSARLDPDQQWNNSVRFQVTHMFPIKTGRPL